MTHRLTRHTMKQFQEKIPFDDLPANFRDAIIVTRELGIRYIWIDSLCILQDSTEDWDAEAKNMGRYYSYSTLTILAQTSEGSTQGFLKPPVVPKKFNPVKLHIDSGDNDERQVTVEWLPYGREDLLMLRRESVLAKRGWTLQEDLLSPRKLHYGKHQIQWKCCETMKSAEDVPSQDPRQSFHMYLPLEFNVLSSVLQGGLLPKPQRRPVDIEEMLTEYYDLLKLYSMRAFEMKKDRLPAFSGLAQRIHKYLEGDYIAGLWSCDFQRNLDWNTRRDHANFDFDFDYEYERCGLRTPKIVHENCPPSWSWAAANQPISFHRFPTNPYDPYGLELLDYRMSYSDPSNPYGIVKAGHLLVRGYTMPVVERTEAYVNKIGSIYFDDPKKGQDGDDHIVKVPIYPVIGIFGRSTKLVLAVEEVSESESKRKDSDTLPLQEHLVLLIRAGPFGGHCLLLRKKDENEEQFERIGHVEFGFDLFPEIEEWTKRDLKLV
ncbi:heterokaryon incompatibility protein-domain-containing protein [Annulohypoxylon moriforme]|nr:heterokaryon incompatibility protein-domain-containing protein [Annulohypoxylon moriforme]